MNGFRLKLNIDIIIKRIKTSKNVLDEQDKMKEPTQLLYSSRGYKEIMAPKRRDEYSDKYLEEEVNELKQKLWKKRQPKSEKIN